MTFNLQALLWGYSKTCLMTHIPCIQKPPDHLVMSQLMATLIFLFILTSIIETINLIQIPLFVAHTR